MENEVKDTNLTENEKMSKMPEAIKGQINVDKLNEIDNTEIVNENITEVKKEETVSDDNNKVVEETKKEEEKTTSNEEQNTSDDKVYDISDAVDSEESYESPLLSSIENGDFKKPEESKKDDSSISFDYEDEDVKAFTSSDDLTVNNDGTADPKDDPNKIYKSYKDVKINNVVNGHSKKSLLKNIKVDLNNLNIITKSPLEQIKDTQAVFDSSEAAFTVVCCQSAYSASLTGLTLTEKNAINNSNLTVFEQRQKLYKTIYNKIVNMSVPKPDFDTWLKITSFGDLNTLLFGIYCQTFIDNNEFDVTCGKCGKTTSIVVDNQSLVEARDKSVYGTIDEVVRSIQSPKDLLDKAVVNQVQRVMLDESKIVVDITNPTLYDHLLMIKSSNPEALKEYPDTFSAMLFIKAIYMIDMETLAKTGSVNYYEVKDREKMLQILLKLSNADGEQLEDAIEAELGKLRIDYSIHRCRCQHCKAILPNIPVNMEDILFTRINRQRKTGDTN